MADHVIGPTTIVLARYFLHSADPVWGWRITPPRFAVSVKCEQIPCDEERAADHALFGVSDESALARGLIRLPEALLHDFDRSYKGSVQVEVVEPMPVNGAVVVAVEAAEAYVTDTATRYNAGHHYHQVEGKELP